MAGWMTAGKLISREDVVTGIENFPATLLRLFNGENFGKLVLQSPQTDAHGLMACSTMTTSLRTRSSSQLKGGSPTQPSQTTASDETRA